MLDPDEAGDSRLRVGRWLPTTGGSARQRARVPGRRRPDDAETVVIELIAEDQAGPPADTPAPPPSRLHPVQFDESRAGRRGRWWFLIVPVAVIVLVVAVALQFRTDEGDPGPPLPQMTPQVALPELSPTPGTVLQPSGTGSGSGTSTASRPASRPAGSAAGTGTGTGTAPAPGGGGTVVGQPGTPVPPAAPPAGPPAGSIVGVASRCLGPEAVGGFTLVQLDTCGGSGQTFSASGGAIRNGDRCLDVFFSGTANGTIVHLHPCNGTGAQQWEIRADGTLRNPQSGRCLSTENGSTSTGTHLVIYDCTGSATQRWTLT